MQIAEWKVNQSKQSQRLLTNQTFQFTSNSWGPPPIKRGKMDQEEKKQYKLIQYKVSMG